MTDREDFHWVNPNEKRTESKRTIKTPASKKIFYIDEVWELLKKVGNSEISFSKMVEMLNEKALPTNPETEDEVLTEISDSFRQMAHDYKDGKIDYRFIFQWFQSLKKHYSIKRKYPTPANRKLHGIK